MAVNIFQTPGGVLNIQGDDGANFIGIFSFGFGTSVITESGFANYGGVTGINVDGNGGDDVIDLSAYTGNVPTTLSGGDGNDTIRGQNTSVGDSSRAATGNDSPHRQPRQRHDPRRRRRRPHRRRRRQV